VRPTRSVERAGNCAAGDKWRGEVQGEIARLYDGDDRDLT